MNSREHIGSRLGFILLSAGCAIGCGNIWKFPWMCGQYGGGSFVLIYLLFLLLLALPVLTMEFAIGRGGQASPIRVYHKLEKPGQKWHWHGPLSLLGNFALMSFYTVVTGWMIYYFVKFLTGQNETFGFVSMISDPVINVGYLFVTIASAFSILCFNLQSGLEKVTKYMMIILFVLIAALAVHSLMLPGAAEGIRFYLLPDFSKINGSVLVGAMSQAFFTVGIGIGSMMIFGSYINKEHSLLKESVNIIALDTLIALLAGLIIFPSCFTYGLEVKAGPSLLFDTMATVFANMPGGRWWGTLFFLFMVFAAMSTVLGVCENILAMIRELTGLNRPKGCLVSGIALFLTSLTTALGFNLIPFQPFAEGSSFLDLWDFILSSNLLPIGALVYVFFCCTDKGWGWKNFKAEANAGNGLKIKDWMKPYCLYILPLLILFIYIYGLVTFPYR